ncbi:MAG: S8 family peptidase [Alcanivoracaceae bacterium]|nr:S8 family peptidase [Alcanivoracaceae bacterium]
MKIINYILALFILLSAHQVSSQSSDGSRPKEIMGLNSASRIADEYIIMLDKNTVDQQAQTLSTNNNISMKQAIEIVVNDICTDLASTAGGNILSTYTIAPYGFALSSSFEQSVSSIIGDSRINYIEVNQTVTGSTTQTSAPWGIDRIDQLNLPLDDSYTYVQDGSDVNVYVLDSGIRITHNDFGSRATSGFTNILDGFGTNDCHGHGTHVAGIIGGETYGVAKDVNLIAVRVLDCFNGGDTIGIIDAITTLQPIREDPAIINISIDVQENSLAFKDRVNSAVESGITIVVSAGNGDEDACNVSPANATGAITVGATSILDARSVFENSQSSNFGSCVDIFAPGSDITSTWAGTNTATNTINGTSMASAHVAGAAALYLEDNSDATPAEVKEAILTNASVVTIGNAGVGSPNKLLNMSNLLAILDPPDIYEEDDNIPAYGITNLIAPNEIQAHNFVDDKYDYVQPWGNSNKSNTKDLKAPGLRGLTISNLGANINLCISMIYVDGLSVPNTIICGISNDTTYYIQSGAYIFIRNQVLGADTNYTIEYFDNR